MLKYAPAATVDKRAPRKAKPQPQVDRKKLRVAINKQFAKTLAYLAK